MCGFRLIDIAPRSWQAVNAVPRNHLAHRRLALVHDLRVSEVEGHPKPVHASRAMGDAAVTKVEPEQVHVGGRKIGEAVPLVTAVIAPLRALTTQPVPGVLRHLSGEPVGDRADRDACALCNPPGA